MGSVKLVHILTSIFIIREITNQENVQYFWKNKGNREKKLRTKAEKYS